MQTGYDMSHECCPETRNYGRGPVALSEPTWLTWLPALVSGTMLLLAISYDKAPSGWWDHWLPRFLWYTAAYWVVARKVLAKAWGLMRLGNYFNEFMLMALATSGAFYLKLYPEAIAVMLFYALGESIQHTAVLRAKRNISALLDVRPNRVKVIAPGRYRLSLPQLVPVGTTIRLLPGERTALDGVLLGDGAADFDMTALTGESRPQTVAPGETVLAGSIALNKMVELRTTKTYKESALARILYMVQDATRRKAPTEQFISRFAKVYTPIVCALALLILLAPSLFVEPYVWKDWLYRALVFLVIACPCALMISIPLGYFGGIGAASRHGILFKGANFLDKMSRINTLAIDKTGTLTQGKFSVGQLEVAMPGISPELLLQWVAALESASNHPIARAIVAFAREKNIPLSTPTHVEELAGLGIHGLVDGRRILAGNMAALHKFWITGQLPPLSPDDGVRVYVAIDGHYAGFFTVADTLKPDAAEAIRRLRKAGIGRIILLSGDRPEIAAQAGQALSLDEARGALLPEDKVRRIEELKKDPSLVVAFAGDGINDAPSIARADIGIAMGGLGSDAAIEIADVVIQTDQPSRIATAMRISRATRVVVWQNISLAFGVKVLVLALGAGGLASMWEAIIADVGVALLAILNAVRVLYMRFA